MPYTFSPVNDHEKDIGLPPLPDDDEPSSTSDAHKPSDVAPKMRTCGDGGWMAGATFTHPEAVNNPFGTAEIVPGNNHTADVAWHVAVDTNGDIGDSSVGDPDAANPKLI